jgi:uncharacterized protein YecE (DUF72 family)
VKAPRLVFSRPDVVCERVSALGDRLGCLRVVVERPRDDALAARLAESAGVHGIRIALDARHESWAAAAGALAAAGISRVNDWSSPLDWRYVRFREPPYPESDLRDLAARLRPLLDAGIEVFGFFRHEDEPTAPDAALRLLELLKG